MATPFTVQQWMNEQAWPLLVVGSILLAGFIILYISARSHRASMLRDRSNRSEDTFVEDLAAFGFDTEIARTTYRYLQDVQNVAFPIVALDDLDRDLGLDLDDLKQTIRDLLELTGRDHLPGLLYSPLVSVEDLVRYIQASPKRNVMAA
jgi:hypothetical protein